jgi:hypothetical protein
VDKATIAQEAASLLENEVLKMALDHVEKDAIEWMIAASTEQQRFEHQMAVRAVRDLRTKLAMFKSDVPRTKPAVV